MDAVGAAELRQHVGHLGRELLVCSLTKLRAKPLDYSAHAQLQRAKAFNASPQAGEVLRRRSAVERLISHLVRMGMRHARFFGMHLVQYQAYLTAAAYNLQRVFTLTPSAAGS